MEAIPQDVDGSSKPNVSARAIDPLEIAVCFLRLGNLNEGMLDLVGRYETRLWRQLAQTVLILDSMRNPISKGSRHKIGVIRANQFSAGHWRGST